jgi:hypothetical protein
MVVKDASLTNGAAVIQWGYSNNATDSDEWFIQDIGSGNFRFINVYSGKALNAADGSTANGVPMIQWPYADMANMANMKFKLVPVN